MTKKWSMERTQMQITWLTIALAVMLTAGCGGSDTASDKTEATTESHANTTMTDSPVAGVTFRFIDTNGIRMRIAEMGDEGPLVLLVHGWPESWYSWRHQLQALADAGYHAVAPDMRGYGGSTVPENIEDYNIVELTADVAGIIGAVIACSYLYGGR